jgi:putative endonuclease
MCAGRAFAWGVVMTHARIALGRTGEDLACAELERRGYAVLARRYRRRGGEIDIVARDGETIVFVEVKARDSRGFGRGADAITGLKRHRMAQLAIDYLARNGCTGRPCRFDVVSIGLETGNPVIEVFQNAFDSSL